MKLSKVILVVLCFASCGYRSMEAHVPGGGSSIIVPMVGNYTSFNGLAEPLTSALRKRIARSGILIVSDEKEALRLEVSLRMISSEPGMLTVSGSRLDSIDSIYAIAADATLVDSAGNPVMGPHPFEVRGRAYSAGNPRSDVVSGRRRLKLLVDDLVENIVTHFLYK